MKKSDKILIYDGSFNGFLSALFLAFKEEFEVADICSMYEKQGGLFSDTLRIKTNQDHAKRVWDGLKKKNYAALKNIYFAFLSETNGIELILHRYVRHIFLNTITRRPYGFDKELSKIHQLASLVSREKQRMESHIQFRENDSDVRMAYVEPAFNVIPLITKHFRSKLGEDRWIIFDLRRNYGMFYNGQNMELVSSKFLNRLKGKVIHKVQNDEIKADAHLPGEAYMKWPFKSSLSNKKSFTAA